MNKRKMERLQANGWKIGNADEFLGLTAEESYEVAIKLALCNLEKQLRRKHEMTQLELARKLGSSQSRVAKLEACDPTVSLDLMVRSCVVLGASGRDFGRAFVRAEQLATA